MTEAPRQLDCALWLADRGMHVFPVDHPTLPKCAGLMHKRDAAPCETKNRGKHPTVKWGAYATTDRATIIRDFSGAPRNIGIACKPSGLLVVDEDEPDALYAYAASVGAVVEPTFTVVTRRGAHFYFRQPDGEQFGNSAGALAPFHIDVRGDGSEFGGYVVGPGSVHSTGHLYRPANAATPINEAPAWLLDALRPKQPEVPAPRTRLSTTGKASHAENVLDGLVRIVETATVPAGDGGGNRNHRLFWAACRAAEHANQGLLNAREAADRLLEAALGKGLSHAEAEGTIRSAYRNTGTRTAR
jgi:hypothetical protein